MKYQEVIEHNKNSNNLRISEFCRYRDKNKEIH